MSSGLWCSNSSSIGGSWDPSPMGVLMGVANVVRDVFIRLVGLVGALGDAGRVVGTDDGL